MQNLSSTFRLPSTPAGSTIALLKIPGIDSLVIAASSGAVTNAGEAPVGAAHLTADRAHDWSR